MSRTISELERSKGRSEGYHSLSVQEQRDEDERLGILGWDGSGGSGTDLSLARATARVLAADMYRDRLNRWAMEQFRSRYPNNNNGKSSYEAFELLDEGMSMRIIAKAGGGVNACPLEFTTPLPWGEHVDGFRNDGCENDHGGLRSLVRHFVMAEFAIDDWVKKRFDELNVSLFWTYRGFELVDTRSVNIKFSFDNGQRETYDHVSVPFPWTR